jgi:lipoprotein-anchoring transpeptidase ErfK/SrfK
MGISGAMYSFRLGLIILLLGLLAGCASTPPGPGPATEAALRAATSRVPTDPADKDPRYALPQAQSRALNLYLGSQTFEYVEDDRVIASGEISSGTAEHPTPAGDFRVQSKVKDKRSGSYTNYFNQNTPMPYALQFHGPYWVHEGWLPGYADSHGCVRLSYEDAHFLFSRMKVGDPIRVKREGEARAASPFPDLFPVF